jgi:hypothetical protein
MSKISKKKSSDSAPIGWTVRDKGVAVAGCGTSSAGVNDNEAVTNCQMICEATSIKLADGSVITLIGVIEMEGALFKVPKRITPPMKFFQDGIGIDESVMRHRYQKAAEEAGIDVEFTKRLWEDVIAGNAYARELVEELCEVKIIALPD